MPLSPVYGIGYLGLLMLEDSDEEDWWPNAPLEARCLVGLFAPLIMICILIMLGFMILKDEFWES